MEFSLKTQKRDLDKKHKNLREEGLVPAEVYGKNHEHIHISVSEKRFNKVFQEAGTTQIVNLDLDSSDEKVPALIYDIQYDPISRKPLAVDFYRVSKDETLTTTIPIKFEGSAPIEKEGFTLIKVLNEVEVEALPQNIPSNLTVDLSELTDEDDRVKIKDLQPGEEVEVKGDPETVIVSITEKREEEEEEEIGIMPGELGELAAEGEEGEEMPEEEMGETPTEGGEDSPEEASEAL